MNVPIHHKLDPKVELIMSMALFFSRRYANGKKEYAGDVRKMIEYCRDEYGVSVPFDAKMSEDLKQGGIGLYKDGKSPDQDVFLHDLNVK